MGKLDELLKSAGGSILESASHRAAPVAMPGTVPITPGGGAVPGVVRSKAAMEIPVGKIERDPAQPREEFDDAALDRLAGSMKSRGQIQPIVVRLDKGRGAYVVVAGERRWRAARRAGIPTLTCIVQDREMSPDELLALQCVENLLREDLRPIEQAKAFRALMEVNKWSGSELARQLDISQPTVVMALRLLDLPAGIQDRVEQGELSPITAYEVSKLDDPAEQAALASEAVGRKLTRSEVQARVTRAKGRGAKPRTIKLPLERKHRAANGLQVLVKGRKGFDEAAWLEALEDAASAVRGSQDRAAGPGEA